MEKHFISRFLTNSAAVTSGTLFSMVFHFISITILTRYFSKDDFGVYVLILIIANFLTKICGLGLDLTIVKFIANNKSSLRGQVVLPILQLRVIMIVIVSLLFYLLGQWPTKLFDQKITDYIFYIPVLMALMSFRDIFYKFFEGQGIFRQYTAIKIASAIVRVLLICFILLFNKLDLSALIGIEIATIFLTVSAQLIFNPLKKVFRMNREKYLYHRILKFCMPIYLNNILSFVYDNLSVFVISAILNPVSIATYAVAQKVPEAFLRIFHSFIVVYFPNASRLFSQGKEKEAREFMDHSLLFCISGSLLMAVIAFIFQKEIIGLIFSVKYETASMAFAFIMLNLSLRIIGNIMGYSIVSAGYSAIPVKANSISCVIGLVSNLLLVPKLGIMGAVTSLILMSIFTLLFYFRFLYKLGMQPVTNNLLKLVLLYFVSIGSYMMIDQEIVIVKTCAVFLYAVLSGILMRNNIIKPTINFFRTAQK